MDSLPPCCPDNQGSVPLEAAAVGESTDLPRGGEEKLALFLLLKTGLLTGDE